MRCLFAATGIRLTAVQYIIIEVIRVELDDGLDRARQRAEMVVNVLDAAAVAGGGGDGDGAAFACAGCKT
jgi:hypothetical protein